MIMKRRKYIGYKCKLRVSRVTRSSLKYSRTIPLCVELTKSTDTVQNALNVLGLGKGLCFPWAAICANETVVLVQLIKKKLETFVKRQRISKAACV